MDGESPVGPRLMTVDATAEWLGVSKQAIWRLIREKRIPAVSVGRYYRFDPQALARWRDAGGAGVDGTP